MRGLLVTGTDTGVGKTVVSAALLAAMGAEGEGVAAFKPAVSPHLAAELGRIRIEPERVLALARAAGAQRTLVVEGVGGLLVPLTTTFSVCDLAVELGLPLVVVARPGLGTISHTLLTVLHARSRGLDVRGVILNRWPEPAGAMERSNRTTIERGAGVEVTTLTELHGPDPRALAAAGAALPWKSWLGGG
ncbi:MAG TPA: dethiobiotin synthase [Solirubrobacteraceae bacterium]|nr:dethiobiotin synthase [Solirubrobacteraceae bacterium]